MTTDSVSAGGDPRRLLSDVRALAHRVRLDQRLTWVALLVLAVATFVAIPFDYYGMDVRCVNGSECQFSRDGVLYYWPAALLIAYTAIAFCYVRAARARGLGARVLPYALTGAALAVVFTAVWLLARVYLADPPTDPFPEWVMVLDRLVAPAGTIGVALLVLARLERNVALLAFTIGYLAVVLVPIDFGWAIHSSVQAEFVPQQVINGAVLLLGAAGFAIARRWQP